MIGLGSAPCLMLTVGLTGCATRRFTGHPRGPDAHGLTHRESCRKQVTPRCMQCDEMSQETDSKMSDWKTNAGQVAMFEVCPKIDPATRDRLKEDQENGRGSETLDDLIGNVRDLELEVEKLRREQRQEITITSSCRFAFQCGHQEEADEGRDILLFLPGISGANFEAVEQLDILSATFDVWSMEVRDNDQSTFVELTEQVIQFMSIVGVTKQKQAVIIGSSFGALLAVNLAHETADSIKGLVLVNPATSYGRSHWRTIGSLVANAPGPQTFGMAATLSLATSIPDTAMFSRYMQEFEALPPQEVAAWFKSITDEWSGRISTLFGKTTQEQLQWRLIHWLEEGSKIVEPLLQELTLPVVVLAGSEDRMLPSVDEAARLNDLIPSCQPIVLRGVGHAALHNLNEVNLRAILGSSVIYDPQLRERTVQSKSAKKAYKRWQKDKGDDGGIDENNGGGDPVLDFKLDLEDEIVNLTWESTQMMDRFTSPIFMSLNERGELQQGLGGVPDHQHGRSILFVGNHQTLGLDMPILVRTILRDKDILVRGLAHPMATGADPGDFVKKIACKHEEADNKKTWKGPGIARGAVSSAASAIEVAVRNMGTTGLTSAKSVANRLPAPKWLLRRHRSGCVSEHMAENTVARPGAHLTLLPLTAGLPRLDGDRPAAPPPIRKRVGDFMAKLGAVPVTARNMLRLFKAGEAVLLYPGGAKEALHQKGQDYQMFWPEKSEFIRMAAAFNATIVPFAAVGSADSVAIWMDLDDIFSLPFGVGGKMKDAADSIPRARQGDDLEYFLPPIVRPKVPARHYFVFGPAVDTSLVDEKDREACQQVYDRTKSWVRGGIHYLLEARQHDPYGDTTKRLLYETVMKTQAPTFPLDAAAFGDFAGASDTSIALTAPE